MRIGIGYDVHKLVAGRPLLLGGVPIVHDRGLEGFSDADVLLHAICDALLGAAALGDIGVLFPDNDPKWRGVDSRILLGKVGTVVSNAGYGITNIDSTVVLQRPRLRPYIEDMRNNIAHTLHLAIDQVSVKATTTEKLGFVGMEQGIVAYAVCLLHA